LTSDIGRVPSDVVDSDIQFFPQVKTQTMADKQKSEEAHLPAQA
jgi:hypothetical protein